MRVRRSVVVAALVLTGCATAGPRLENGVFRAPDLFRVTVPGVDWVVAPQGRAELELHHRARAAGMFVNAECGTAAARGDLDATALARRLFVGMREHDVLENGAATLDGAPALRAVVEARVGGRADAVRLEVYVMKDARCVYDLVYAAPPADFAAGRQDFERFVESFARE
jgi:hypothetical protein